MPELLQVYTSARE